MTTNLITPASSATSTSANLSVGSAIQAGTKTSNTTDNVKLTPTSNLLSDSANVLLGACPKKVALKYVDVQYMASSSGIGGGTIG